MADAPKYSNNLKYWIKQSGYKLYEVADEVDIPLRTLNDYCAGRVAIPKKKLEAIAQFINCPISLLNGEKNTSLIGQNTDIVNEHRTDLSRQIHADSLQEMINTNQNNTTPSPQYPASPLWERLSRTLENFFYIDKSILSGLEQITANYWQLRTSIGYQNLLPSFLVHLETVIQLLQNPQTFTTRKHLCTIASEIAQRIGAIYFDMNNFTAARAYYDVSLKAAQEGENTLLRAIGLGRISSLHIYRDHPEDALPLLQESCQIAIRYNSFLIIAWTASLEAEVHANLKNKIACHQSLEQSEKALEHASSDEKQYNITFDHARLTGYKGTCFLHLQDTNRAITALCTGLHSSEGVSPRQNSIFLVDLAEAYRQQGDLERVCNYALQALGMTDQTKSNLVMLRLHKLQQRIAVWGSQKIVKDFSEQMVLRTTSIT